VVKVVTEKQDGLQITNTDALAEYLIAALERVTPLGAAFASTTVEPVVEQVDAPQGEDDGDEDRGATEDGEDVEGDSPAALTAAKWIDVDLSAKTVTAYVGDTPVWGPRSVVDGKPGNETATGTSEIYLRYEQQDMTNAAYSPEDHPKYYYTEDVP